ncbi:MAG TPA: hypothetical protein VFN71_06185 [Methylomirabilota bacterium]|nr:hypothetical protein [Methylomirabilota bacterium]
MPEDALHAQFDRLRQDLRQDMQATAAALCQEIHASAAENRPHFEVVAEGLRAEIQVVAEGLRSPRQRTPGIWFYPYETETDEGTQFSDRSSPNLKPQIVPSDF